MKGLCCILRYTVLGLVLVATSGSQGIDQTLFHTVPPEQRESLMKRLSLYLEYSRRGEALKQKELYDNVTLCSLCQGKVVVDHVAVDCGKKFNRGTPGCLKCVQDFCKGDSECVKECHSIHMFGLAGLHSEITEIKLRSVQLIKGKVTKYIIVFDETSSLTTNGETQIVKGRSSLTATLQNGDWYFSMIL